MDNTLALIILCYIISHPMTPIITQDKEDRFNQFAFHYRLYPFLALLILFFIGSDLVTNSIGSSSSLKSKKEDIDPASL